MRQCKMEDRAKLWKNVDRKIKAKKKNILINYKKAT